MAASTCQLNTRYCLLIEGPHWVTVLHMHPCTARYSMGRLAGLHCRKRIADQQFDDPPKVVPPPPEKQKVVVELDDKRSSKVHTHPQGVAEGLQQT